MNPLDTAIKAARAAGSLLRENYEKVLDVNELKQYDIKLALDVECQDLITKIILDAFPDHAILGEEGFTGNADNPSQWIVDPLDGTVNYFYGIPHFCVSIALRQGDVITHGVVYDPLRDELWAAEKGGVTTLNDRPLRVSSRTTLGESLVTCGFSKTAESLNAGMIRYQRIATQVRKTRLLGSAALALAYVACGRLDAYIEEQISLWDIAAGLLLVECAGGRTDLAPSKNREGVFGIVSTNGHIHEAVTKVLAG